MTATEIPEIELISLQPFSEIRFLMNIGDKVVAELPSPTDKAISYGWVLPTQTQIEFSNQSFSIATKTGCTLKISGRYVSYYSTEFNDENFVICPYMKIVKSINESLANSHPPTVFLVGAPSVGKTTLCKWICNSILNTSHVPIYVNADPDQAPFCPPGCIGAIPITKPINNYGFPFTDPLMYMFSATKVDDKRDTLYVDQFKELLRHVAERRKLSGAQDGGTIIDFPAVTNKCIFDILNKAINNYDEGIAKSLGPLKVIVVGNDNLYTNLVRAFPQLGQQMEKMPMFPGVIPLSKEAKTEIRRSEIARYFYGDGNRELFPQTYLLVQDEIPLYSLGQWRVLNDSMMPIQFELPDPRGLFPVSFGDRLRRYILAVLPQENKSIIWKQSILGFVHVIDLDDEKHIDDEALHDKKKQLTILKPNSDPLTKCVLIASEVKWDPKS